MSPRKTILRELSRREGADERRYTRPSTIPGFSEQPDRYQKAVNELLQARLVEGLTDEEGRMAIAINEHRIADVRRELRPIWARPLVWVTLVLALAALGVGLAP